MQSDVIIYWSLWGNSLPFHREVRGQGRPHSSTLGAGGKAQLCSRTLKKGSSSQTPSPCFSILWTHIWNEQYCTSINFGLSGDRVDSVPWHAPLLQCNLTQWWSSCAPFNVPALWEVMKWMKGEFRGKQFKQTIKSSQWCKMLARASSLVWHI